MPAKQGAGAALLCAGSFGTTAAKARGTKPLEIWKHQLTTQRTSSLKYFRLFDSKFGPASAVDALRNRELTHLCIDRCTYRERIFLSIQIVGGKNLPGAENFLYEQSFLRHVNISEVLFKLITM